MATPTHLRPDRIGGQHSSISNLLGRHYSGLSRVLKNLVSMKALLVDSGDDDDKGEEADAVHDMGGYGARQSEHQQVLGQTSKGGGGRGRRRPTPTPPPPPMRATRACQSVPLGVGNVIATEGLIT